MARDRDTPESPTPMLERSRSGRVDRRGAMRLLGFGAIAVSPLAILPSILRATVGRGPVRSHGEPARAPSGRIRQWVMIIDLRYCDGCQKTKQPPQCTAACIEGRSEERRGGKEWRCRWAPYH